MRIGFLLIVVLASVCCTPEKKETTFNIETYRPHYHFTPTKNWTNDPNGLVFHDGEYHLFYQYNPYGDKWGHMSWGHAISSDLLHWEHLPVAIAEYQDRITGDSTMIFSGTVVSDTRNTSGLGNENGCLVAIFTSHVHKNGQGLKQHQSLAYSTDNGRTWKLYDQNPILDIGRKDFRDPKVFWYEPQKKWVMVLVVPDLYKVQFYQSKNLLKWDLMSEFGDVGDTTRIWECPDLYQLPVEGSNESKWVLSLSGSHPAGPKFVGMQYFVGEFDGTAFISKQKEARYVDHGKDFYAGIVFNNVPDRTLMMGWINNWTYANDIPTSPWRGAMSLPRELTLTKNGDDYLLNQRPLKKVSDLRKEVITDLAGYSGGSFEIELLWKGGDGTILEMFSKDDEKTIIGKKDNTLFIDRTHSGKTDFQPDFASIDFASVKGDTVKIHAFVDQSIIELFINDGEATITSQVFPTKGNRIVIPNREQISGLRVWEMKSALR